MIEVKHLTKRYGTQTAVSDLTFSVGDGQIYGFLGPNGAGKSTTMNIMTGCLAASSGEISVGGYDIFEDAMKARRLIGYLPEQPPLYLDRTPREYLDFVARAKGVSTRALNEQISKVMELTDITTVQDRLIKNLSKGYRQRVGIAQALLGDPKVIILDEPTVGLDPKQIIEIRDLIRSLGKEHTVILSSHILSEVQAICETVLILSKGKLVACDTPENLEKLFAGKTTVEMTVDAAAHEAEEILSGVAGVKDVDVQQRDDGTSDISLDTGGEDLRRELFFAFAGSKTAILRMNESRASLEDIFIELTAEAQSDSKTNSKSDPKQKKIGKSAQESKMEKEAEK